jgi:hypothetical protein
MTLWAFAPCARMKFPAQEAKYHWRKPVDGCCSPEG